MFYIPVYNWDKFEKKVNTIRNKGVDVTLTKGDPVVMAFTDAGFADPDVKRGTPAWEMSFKTKFIPVEVEGKYEIPGWEFVAAVEHTPKGNIIRKIDPTISIPEKYYDMGPECEHCHKIRDRNDTYLVRNTDTGEFKQVGKTCLRGYTGGLDSKVAAEAAEFINIEDLFGTGEFEWIDELLSYRGSGGGKYYDADRFKRVVYNYVKGNGYQKDNPGYANDLSDAYSDEKSSLATDEEMDAINKWVLNLDTKNNDYYRNAFLAWNLEDVEPRHFKLIASLINTYLKDMQKKKQQELSKANSTASQYGGEVGDKIVITIASAKYLYSKSFYSGRYLSETPVYKIVGEDGNIYIWSTNTTFSEGDTIACTVKSHSEYNGEAQTVITRGKVIDKETGKPKSKSSENEQLYLDEE